MDRSQAKSNLGVGENLILHSFSWEIWSTIHPKLKSKLGGEVQENTRQYREAKEANVVCLLFLTNISANFLNFTSGDGPVGLVH